MREGVDCVWVLVLGGLWVYVWGIARRYGIFGVGVDIISVRCSIQICGHAFMAYLYGLQKARLQGTTPLIEIHLLQRIPSNH